MTRSRPQREPVFKRHVEPRTPDSGFLTELSSASGLMSNEIHMRCGRQEALLMEEEMEKG